MERWSDWGMFVTEVADGLLTTRYLTLNIVLVLLFLLEQAVVFARVGYPMWTSFVPCLRAYTEAKAAGRQKYAAVYTTVCVLCTLIAGADIIYRLTYAPGSSVQMAAGPFSPLLPPMAMTVVFSIVAVVFVIFRIYMLACLSVRFRHTKWFGLGMYFMPHLFYGVLIFRNDMPSV